MSKLNRVLVVDDDPIITKSFERSLPKTEYVVVTASSGSEALEKLKEGNYDVVFTDIKMPGMSGLELTKQIRAKQTWTPVVIISGFGSKENQEAAQDLGVSDFIHKPLTPEMIETAAHKAVEVPAMQAPIWGIESPVTEETKIVSPMQTAKNIALFMVAPFIGLLYALAMPIIGLGMLLTIASKALFKSEKAKSIGLLMASPFIGLAYAVAMPFVGIGGLMYVGGKTLLKKS